MKINAGLRIERSSVPMLRLTDENKIDLGILFYIVLSPRVHGNGNAKIYHENPKIVEIVLLCSNNNPN